MQATLNAAVFLTVASRGGKISKLEFRVKLTTFFTKKKQMENLPLLFPFAAIFPKNWTLLREQFDEFSNLPHVSHSHKHSTYIWPLVKILELCTPSMNVMTRDHCDVMAQLHQKRSKICIKSASCTWHSKIIFSEPRHHFIRRVLHGTVG